MKQIQKITALFSTAVLLLITGCIKDRAVTAPTKEQSPSPFTVDFNNQLETASLDIVPGATIYTFYAELNAATGIYPAGTVTITKNAALIPAPYTFLPDSSFSLVSSTVTVNPVTHLAAFQLSITSSKIDLAGSYAVAYTITSTTTGATIAGNKKDILIYVGAKNRWDGVYKYISGFVQRYSAPGSPICCDGLTGPLAAPANPNIELKTVNGTTVKFQGLGGGGAPVGLTWTLGPTGVAGIDNLTATMDPATNTIVSMQSNNLTLVKWVGFGGPPGPTGPPPVNTYDPATKRFHFAMRWNPTANVREYQAILEYVGPR